MIRSTEVPHDSLAALVRKIKHEMGFSEYLAAQMMDLLQTGRAFLSVREDGYVKGGIGFHEARCPNMGDKVILERMVYVAPEFRHSGLGDELVARLEQHARDGGCTAVLAGSSLNNHDAALKLYEARGYKTNFTFRKELT